MFKKLLLEHVLNHSAGRRLFGFEKGGVAGKLLPDNSLAVDEQENRRERVVFLRKRAELDDLVGAQVSHGENRAVALYEGLQQVLRVHVAGGDDHLKRLRAEIFLDPIQNVDGG